MATILAFANQKGGVGKTTSAINVAAALGLCSRRVLLIDADPQGNCTGGVGLSKNDGVSLYDVLVGTVPMSSAIQQTAFRNLWAVPSTMDLAGAELEIASRDHRESLLSAALLPVASAFDYVIIDCPPSLGLVTLNALVAADHVIVPMQCEYFALEGLSQLSFTIRNVRRTYNPRLEIAGVILTMFDGRLNLSHQVAREIRRHFEGKVFKNTVPRSVRLSEAPSHGKPICYYDRYSKGGLAYAEIAQEIIRRLEKGQSR
ncbi:MAG: ParA family protein [Clostridia bacterium]|nr:ParA family protein [Clostridia bacterium]